MDGLTHVNRRLNRRNGQQAKGDWPITRWARRKAQGLSQNDAWAGVGARRSPTADVDPPADRRNPTHADHRAERDNPDFSPSVWSTNGKQPAKAADERAGRGEPKKRTLACNEPDND